MGQQFGNPLFSPQNFQLWIHLRLWLCHCSCRGTWSERLSSTWEMVLFGRRLHSQWHQVMDIHVQWRWRWLLRSHKGYNTVGFWLCRQFQILCISCRAFGEWLFVLGVYAVARWDQVYKAFGPPHRVKSLSAFIYKTNLQWATVAHLMGMGETSIHCIVLPLFLVNGWGWWWYSIFSIFPMQYNRNQDTSARNLDF